MNPPSACASRAHDDDRPGMARFYLGTHQPHWLWRTDVPLFLSRRALQRRAIGGLRPARGRWALDSGGFTELALHGRWTLPPHGYAELVATYAERIGGLDFAAPQDWMCEPTMITRTGLSVREHIYRTVHNSLELTRLAPHLPWIRVLQGDTRDDYHWCRELYAQAGIDLTTEATVGLGSVCRRQGTREITTLVTDLATHGLRLHGFGVKTDGLHRYGHLLASADSLAWSYRARRSPPLPDCTGHRNCANCLTYALAWRRRLLTSLTTPTQPTQFDHTTTARTSPGRSAA